VNALPSDPSVVPGGTDRATRQACPNH